MGLTPVVPPRARPSFLRAVFAAALVVAGATLTAGAEEVRGFQRLDRAPTPGERAGAALRNSFNTLGDPSTALARGVARLQDQPGAVTVGNGVSVGVVGGALPEPENGRSASLLGSQRLYDYSGFDRSNSRAALGSYGWYGYAPLTDYSPAWRDRSFASRIGPNDIAGLPSVSAPRSFWGFRD